MKPSKLFIVLRHQFNIALAALFACIAIPLSAETVEIDGLLYELTPSTKTAKITGYTNVPYVLVIQPTVNYSGADFKIIEIKDDAFLNCNSLESITIPATVTRIGYTRDWREGDKRPFKGCSALKTVHFKDGEEQLKLGVYYDSSSGKGLFSDCPLEEVYLGRNIQYEDYSNYPFDKYPKYYGYSAFYNQTNLAKVTIGPGATIITPYLFYMNKAISSLHLPKVDTICKSAFEGAHKLTILTFGDALKSVGESAFKDCDNITNLSLPDATETIADNAFYGCSSVTSINLGTGVKEVGAGSFAKCSALTAIRFPSCQTSLGESAFEDCIKLTYVSLGGNLAAVGAKAFKNCVVLSEMVVPDNVTSIGDEAFYGCSGIAAMTLSAKLKTIGARVFWNNSGLVSLSVPGTVESMGQNCFYGCTRLMYLTFEDGTTEMKISTSGSLSAQIPNQSSADYQKCGYSYFYDSPIRVLYIGKDIEYSSSESLKYYNIASQKLEYQPSAPFANKKTLKSVTIGPNVTYLSSNFLNGCSELTKIVLPEGLKSIYSYAFANCTGLTSLDFPGSLTFLGDNVVKGSVNISKLKFNDGTETLKVGSNGAESLFSSQKLQSVYIGKNITYTATKEYGYSPFYCQYFMSEVEFSQSGTVTSIHDNLLYKCDNIKSLILPESLTSIGAQALREMKYLETLVIPNNVKTIGEYGISYCDSLKSISLSNSLKVLEKGLLSTDKSLKTVSIPNGITDIRDAVLYDCIGIEQLSIPASVVSIGNNVFVNCISMKNLRFEDGAELLQLGYINSRSIRGMFRDCPLESLYLGRWLTYETTSADISPFAYVKTLKKVTIGENVPLIGKYAFTECSSLPEIYLPDKVGTVALDAFSNCSSLASVRLSGELISLGERAFKNCIALATISLPSKLDAISEETFYGCTSLKTAYLGNINTIGPRAFMNCTKLNEAVIPETVYGLGVESFKNCVSLPSAQIPKLVSTVGASAFAGCTGLKVISLSSKVTSLGENSFAGDDEIKYIKSYNAFPPEGLPGFTDIVKKNATLFVPETSIDMYAFSPTWEDFLNIRVISEDVLVTNVSISKASAELKVDDVLQLTATASPEEATNKDIVWNSLNDDIASVDSEGKVTALSVGETVIKAIAADGSGEYATCDITVLPTLVETINVNFENITIKKGRTEVLVATVFPTNATNKHLSFQTSDTSIATIDDLGVITAVNSGNTTITITTLDGSDVSKTVEITVIPPTKGDSNDDDRVTVTDAVNTAFHVMGTFFDDYKFIFEAADVNCDNKITMSDASGTITIALSHPINSNTYGAMMLTSAIGSDNIIISDYAIAVGENGAVGISLNNRIDYVALQFDIELPIGMEFEGVKTGDSISNTHSLRTYKLNENTMRIILFAMDNEVIQNTEEPLVILEVKNKSSECGRINAYNILSTDETAIEHRLFATGGENKTTLVADNITDNDISTNVCDNTLVVNNAVGYHCYIYSIDGMLIDLFKIQTIREIHSLTTGVYIVKIGNKIEKIIIK